MMKTNDTMATSHGRSFSFESIIEKLVSVDGLKFIQHEYEQFGANMEEKD